MLLVPRISNTVTIDASRFLDGCRVKYEDIVQKFIEEYNHSVEELNNTQQKLTALVENALYYNIGCIRDTPEDRILLENSIKRITGIDAKIVKINNGRVFLEEVHTDHSSRIENGVVIKIKNFSPEDEKVFLNQTILIH